MTRAVQHQSHAHTLTHKEESFIAEEFGKVTRREAKIARVAKRKRKQRGSKGGEIKEQSASICVSLKFYCCHQAEQHKLILFMFNQSRSLQ